LVVAANEDGQSPICLEERPQAVLMIDDINQINQARALALDTMGLNSGASLAPELQAA
jgi:hypothetical protein